MTTRKAFSRALGAVLAAVGTLLLLHSLWQLAAGWALRAELKAETQAGLPGSLQDLTPPAVKPEDNAAVLLQTAFALMQKDRGVSPEPHPLVKEIIQCRLDVGPDREGRNLRTLDADALRALREKLHTEPVVTILALLREAAEKPGCDFEVNFGAGPAVFLPHLIHMRSAVRLLIAEAWMRAQEGDLSACLNNLHVCLRLTHHLRAEPMLFSQLVRVNCDTLTIECIYEVLSRNSCAEIPPEEARILFAELYRRLDPENRYFVRALDGERICFGGWFFHGILTSRLKRKDLGDIGLRDIPRLYTSYLWRPLLKMEFRRYLQVMGRYRKAIGKPYPVATSEMQADLSLPGYCVVARRMLSAARTAHRAAVHHQALVEMARLGLGLCFHHRSHNSYPATLEELKSFPRLPLDPFTASPFRYIKAGDGFVLRSVGPNGCEEADGAKSDDLVWRITAGH